jgi:cystathionine beta-lyase/cystathionine gamma-synthase
MTPRRGGSEAAAPTTLAAAPIASRRRPGPLVEFPELPEGLGPATSAVHAGRRPELNAGAVVPPIYQTSTFRFPAAFSEAATGGRVHLYTRYENPTQTAAAEVLRALEGAGSARVFSSGMAAISSTLLTFLRAGDVIAAPEELYGGTLGLLHELFPGLGIQVQWIPRDTADPDREITGRPRVVYLETPTNPLLRVHDISRWAAAADARGALLIVDNTFATPILQRPLARGADVVVHSASKYLGGHSDLIAGAVAGPAPLIERIATTHRLLGGTLDPFAAFLLHRGMRTLPLRVTRQSASGASIADRLDDHPRVGKVHYPGRATPEQEGIAARQMSGRGGMVSFEVLGGAPATERFLRELRIVQVAASLGAVESLVSRPFETSHAHLAPGERQRLGIPDGLVRLSVGIEDPDDLWEDLDRALRASG